MPTTITTAPPVELPVEAVKEREEPRTERQTICSSQGNLGKPGVLLIADFIKEVLESASRDTVSSMLELSHQQFLNYLAYYFFFEMCKQLVLVKFGFSENHTKFEKILLMLWMFAIVNLHSMRKSAQIFVCFSESPNFKSWGISFIRCHIH